MDKTPSDERQAPRSDFNTGLFALDHAREEFVRQIGDIPLGAAESRWVLYALATFTTHELEAVSSLLAHIRRDGPL